MRVLLTCGGTAGHINPALAIAETIRKNDPNAVIAFAGTEKGKEAVLIPREGYPLSFVRSVGFARPLFSPINVKAAWLAFYSPYAKQTTDILKEFRPDIVIGTGGYACWPIAAAAIRMNIPCALHESNVLPGLAIRRLQKSADRIWTHFEQTSEHLRVRDSVLRVGNPLRNGFGAISREEARKKLGVPEGQFRILSFGGSMGAEPINRAVLDLMQKVSSKKENVVHLHAAGTKLYDGFLSDLRAAGLDQRQGCIAQEYIYDMPYQMAAADLVISRAGAMTLSELARMGKAAILIPSPHVVENHQYHNAKVLADAGAAILVREEDAVKGALGDTVGALLADMKKVTSLSRTIGKFADGDANKRIWEDILQLVKK